MCCSDFGIAEIAAKNFYVMIAEIEAAHSMITVTAVHTIVGNYRGVSSWNYEVILLHYLILSEIINFEVIAELFCFGKN